MSEIPKGYEPVEVKNSPEILDLIESKGITVQKSAETLGRTPSSEESGYIADAGYGLEQGEYNKTYELVQESDTSIPGEVAIKNVKRSILQKIFGRNKN